MWVIINILKEFISEGIKVVIGVRVFGKGIDGF